MQATDLAKRINPTGRRIKTSTLLRRYLTTLIVPAGALAGEAFNVMPWQRSFLERFDRPGDIALTVARGNGKTGLCAAVAAGFIHPATGLAVPGGDVIIVASAHRQARIAFQDVLTFLRQSLPLDDKSEWRVNDSAQHSEIRHLATNCRC